MILRMESQVITSEPPATVTQKTKKRKMSAAGRKAISDAAKARWAAKMASPVTPELAPIAPMSPSPAVLQLQAQVVDMVSQRQQARSFLNESHNAYLAAQAKFQAAENELKGIEAEVQYRIGLIAQLENRQPTNVMPFPVAQFGTQGVSSEPAPQQPAQRPQTYATGSADDLRREFKGMM